MRTKPMISMLTWILFCGFFYSVVSECDTGWFGSDCQYKCHCKDNKCDASGICTPGSTCEKEWFGPACQFANLAYTDGISSIPSLINKDDTTCVNDADVQQVKFTFTYPTPVTWMRIEVKDTDQVPKFLLQFKPHNTDSVIDCKNLRKATVTKTSMDVYCDLDDPVDEVILKGEGVQSLCSISISGGRNVALKQNTSQSSDHSYKHVSKYAVDGSVEKYGRYTHTKGTSDPSPNWNVTFTKPKLVNRYVLYNRPDGCCQDRLKGFVLKSFTKDGSTIFEYKDTEPSSQARYNVISTGVNQPVSRVMIQATYVDNGKIILSLGEVEIFGECPSKYHGIDCKERCNTNCLNELCNATTGVCLECKSGKLGDYCQSDCLAKTFGKGCKETCSNNCGEGPSKNTVCDSVNGTCLFGCKTGYLGLICNNECPHEKYGPGCLEDCSIYCNRNFTDKTSVCNHVNGQCLHGCIKGFEGDICSTFKDDQSTEESSGLKIGIGISSALLVIAIIVIVIVVFWFRRRSAKNQHPVSYDHADVNQGNDHDYKDADGYDLPRNLPIVQESPSTHSDLPENVKGNDTEMDETDHYEYIRDQLQTRPLSKDTDSIESPQRKDGDRKSDYENQTIGAESLRQNVMYENEMTLKKGNANGAYEKINKLSKNNENKYI